jgi:hypothetical protein
MDRLSSLIARKQLVARDSRSPSGDWEKAIDSDSTPEATNC